MPRSHKGHKDILFIIDEVTNYFVTVPIFPESWIWIRANTAAINFLLTFFNDFIIFIHIYFTHYLLFHIFQARSEEIGETLIENVIMKYCIAEYIIMDQDSAFMSSLMTYLFHKFDIKIKTLAPYNHQSLQAEHRIKSLSCILTKHLTSLGQMWTKYLSLATFAYNMFNTPNLGNYSPYELTFWQKT